MFYTGVAAAAAVFLHPAPRLIYSNDFTRNLPAPVGWHYGLLGIWKRFDGDQHCICIEKKPAHSVYGGQFTVRRGRNGRGAPSQGTVQTTNSHCRKNHISSRLYAKPNAVNPAKSRPSFSRSEKLIAAGKRTSTYRVHCCCEMELSLVRMM